MVLRAVAAAALTALALTACGGDEDKQVKQAIGQFVSDAQVGNAQGVCDGLAPATRRLLDVIARGRGGEGADCVDVAEDLFGDGSGGLDLATQQAIDGADVDIDGDRASVKAGGDERRLPLEKVDGRWRLALADLPQPGFALRASAGCTERTLRSIRRPLPAPTRAGIAREAERNADEAAALARALERGEPPGDAEDARDRAVEILKGAAAEWRRAARGIRGVVPPQEGYNRALRSLRAEDAAAVEALTELKVGCYGDAVTLRSAADLRRSARRICGQALRAIDRIPDGPALVRRLVALGRTTARRLRRQEAPEGLAKPYRAAVGALEDAYASLPRVARGDDVARAQERFELRALRSGIGFSRLGLHTCSEL